jgi:hypothetical protein
VGYKKEKKQVEPTISVVGYRVVVAPGILTRACWEFICLLPCGATEEEDLVVVKHLCENFLENDDIYSIYRITSEYQEQYKQGTPIITFDPSHQDQYSWLFPPYHERN